MPIPRVLPNDRDQELQIAVEQVSRLPQMAMLVRTPSSACPISFEVCLASKPNSIEQRDCIAIPLKQP